MANPLKAVAGNTAPQYQWVAERDDGSLVPLTGATVTMKLYRGKTQTNITSGHDAVTVISTATSIIGWTPQTGDLPLAGDYFGDVYVAYPDGGVEVLFGQATFEVGALGVDRS